MQALLTHERIVFMTLSGFTLRENVRLYKDDLVSGVFCFKHINLVV